MRQRQRVTLIAVLVSGLSIGFAQQPDSLGIASLSGDELGTVLTKLPAAGTPAELADALSVAFDLGSRLSNAMLEEAANKFRRTRIRLTEKNRDEGRRPFQIADDFEEHLRLYSGKPVTVYGSLKKWEPIADRAGFHIGEVRLTDSELQVQVVARFDGQVGDLPQPVRMTGYVFGNGKPEPGIIMAVVRFEPITAEVDLELLKLVNDRTVGVAKDQDEADVYYRILAQAAHVPDAELERAAAEYIQERLAEPKEQRPSYLTDADKVFYDVFKRPDVYRGRAVTMTGTLRKLTTYKAHDNEFGVGTLYEGWVFPDESRNNPVVVVFTDNGKALPLGSDVSARVTFTGYFFKMYGYTASNSTRVAPMVLSRTVTRAPVATGGMQGAMWIGVGVGAVLLLVAAVFVGVLLRDRSVKTQVQPVEDVDLANITEDAPPDFSHLSEGDGQSRDE